MHVGEVCCLARLSFLSLCKPLIPEWENGRGDDATLNSILPIPHKYTHTEPGTRVILVNTFFCPLSPAILPTSLPQKIKVITTRKARFGQMLRPRGFPAAIYWSISDYVLSTRKTKKCTHTHTHTSEWAHVCTSLRINRPTRSAFRSLIAVTQPTTSESRRREMCSQRSRFIIVI